MERSAGKLSGVLSTSSLETTESRDSAAPPTEDIRASSVAVPINNVFPVEGVGEEA